MLLRKHNFLPHNIYNMGKKSFLLGMPNRAKVIVRWGRRPPRETKNGLREWITAIETCCANNAMLPPMVIYHSKCLYRSWFGANDDYAGQTAPNQSKQPGGNLAYTLSTTVASYSHCFESLDRKRRWKTCLEPSGQHQHPIEVLALESAAE